MPYLYIVSFVVILSNWVCDNWVYRFPTVVEKINLPARVRMDTPVRGLLGRWGLQGQFHMTLFFLRIPCEIPRPRQLLGIVRKVFSEKASAIARMRQKCVRSASTMRQNGSCLLGREERSKMRQKMSKMYQNARNTFGVEHLLDDTELLRSSGEP